MMNTQIKGVGVSLRQPHYEQFILQQAKVPWVEILSDNYFFTQGILRDKLLRIREHYPMVMHSTGLNIGSVDPLNVSYLKALKQLATDIEASWISDHLCWTSVNQNYSHDLLPLPYTEEALNHVAERIDAVQNFLGQQILIENVSSYVQADSNAFSEAEFLNQVAQKSDCLILLDVNNIYVSAHNHDFQSEEYFQYIDKQRVKQMHLAGFTEQDGLFIDTHGAKVHPPVWDLYQKAIEYFGPVATNIEWDNNIPAWETLQDEIDLARDVMTKVEGYDVAC